MYGYIPQCVGIHLSHTHTHRTHRKIQMLNVEGERASKKKLLIRSNRVHYYFGRFSFGLHFSHSHSACQASLFCHRCDRTIFKPHSSKRAQFAFYSLSHKPSHSAYAPVTMTITKDTAAIRFFGVLNVNCYVTGCEPNSASRRHKSPDVKTIGTTLF